MLRFLHNCNFYKLTGLLLRSRNSEFNKDESRFTTVNDTLVDIRFYAKNGEWLFVFYPDFQYTEMI